MEFGFEFDWNCVKSGAPTITISPYGIVFNSTSISMLGEPEEILIGFDRKKLCIGIKPYEGEEGANPYAFARKNKNNNNWIRIGAKEFIRYISKLTGTDYEHVSKKYNANFDEEKRILYVELIKEQGNKSED